MKYSIRFNQTRGQAGRGTLEHVWRVFEGELSDRKEYLAKNVTINVPSKSERELDQWNITCEGIIEIQKDTSTIIIKSLL
jgi:hypothetical protein